MLNFTKSLDLGLLRHMETKGLFTLADLRLQTGRVTITGINVSMT